MNTLGKIGIAIIILAFSINAMNAQEGKWDLTIAEVKAYEQIKVDNAPGYNPFVNVWERNIGDTLVVVGERSHIDEFLGEFIKMEYFFLDGVLVKTQYIWADYYGNAKTRLQEDIDLLEKLDIWYSNVDGVLNYSSKKGATTISLAKQSIADKEEGFVKYVRTRINPRTRQGLIAEYSNSAYADRITIENGIGSVDYFDIGSLDVDKDYASFYNEGYTDAYYFDGDNIVLYVVEFETNLDTVETTVVYGDIKYKK